MPCLLKTLSAGAIKTQNVPACGDLRLAVGVVVVVVPHSDDLSPPLITAHSPEEALTRIPF